MLSLHAQLGHLYVHRECDSRRRNNAAWMPSLSTGQLLTIAQDNVRVMRVPKTAGLSAMDLLRLSPAIRKTEYRLPKPY